MLQLNRPLLLNLAFVSICAPSFSQTTLSPAQPQSLQLKDVPRREIKFAVIGDYGYTSAAESQVANLVKSADVDFIITVGDNNYDLGAASTIDVNIGQYYHEYIYPYSGNFGLGAQENKFFPSLGNHDWYTPAAQPYLNYFTLPGNERYYDFRKGPVHFFAIDSDPNEPDGFFSFSVQALWLQNALASSTAPFKIVYFHHAPYSSADHGPNFWMQWPYKQWGASMVLNGHDHSYERLVEEGIPYIVNGLGGKTLYTFGDALYGSQKLYNSDFGAMFVEANDERMTCKFTTRSGVVMDMFTIHPSFQHYTETPIVPLDANWKYWDKGTNLGTAWRQLSFNDASWSFGNAQLGYGDGDETTVVGFGPDSSNKYITTYFRKIINVTNPADFTHIGLRLLRDDGAVVYLNGSEIYRTNMPPGPVLFSTLASDGVGDLQEFAYFGTILPASLLAAGQNILAIEVHQRDAQSSDMSFALQLVGLSGDSTLISKGSVWNFWDHGSLPAGDWTGPDYDISNWGSGAAPLGYGDGDEATVVAYGPNINFKYTTSYFRRLFNVADTAAIHNLVMRAQRDDGIIVYLNGHEVHRNNMPGGFVSPATFAPVAVGGAEESQYIETWLDKRYLVNGRNVLAVEIHQASSASSDISFDLELAAF